MSKRFDRKEFVATLRIDPYSWRTFLGIFWKLVLLAVLLWIFPIEKYGIEQENGKWYFLGFCFWVIFLAWDLLRRRSSVSFNICPNCGKKINIRLSPVSMNKADSGVLNLLLLPKGAVAYRDGICPHCREYIWSEEVESHLLKFTEQQLQDSLNVIATPRYIPLIVLVLMLFAAASFGMLWGLAKIYMLIGTTSATLILFIAFFLLFSRYFLGIIIRYAPIISCPACRTKLIDTEIEIETGRCHSCGKLIADINHGAEKNK